MSALRSAPDCPCSRSEVFFPDVSAQVLRLVVRLAYQGRMSSVTEAGSAQLRAVLVKMLGFPRDAPFSTDKSNPNVWRDNFECVLCGDRLAADKLYEHMLKEIEVRSR